MIPTHPLPLLARCSHCNLCVMYGTLALTAPTTPWLRPPRPMGSRVSEPSCGSHRHGGFTCGTTRHRCSLSWRCEPGVIPYSSSPWALEPFPSSRFLRAHTWAVPLRPGLPDTRFRVAKISASRRASYAEIFVGKSECGEPVAGWRSRWLGSAWWPLGTRAGRRLTCRAQRARVNQLIVHDDNF